MVPLTPTLPRTRTHTSLSVSVQASASWKAVHAEPNHPTHSLALSSRAIMLQALGRLPEAEEQLRTALLIDTAVFGADSPRATMTAEMLAFVQQGRAVNEKQ